MRRTIAVASFAALLWGSAFDLVANGAERLPKGAVIQCRDDLRAADPETQAKVDALLADPLKRAQVELPRKTKFAPVPQPRTDAGSLLTGTVKAEGRIDVEKGQPRDLHVVSGGGLLAEAVLRGVRQWRYSQLRIDGVVHEMALRVECSFEREGKRRN